MDYPVERPGIRFYKFYFDGIPEPITIEAPNSVVARATLNKVVNEGKINPKYKGLKPIGERVSTPVKGVSEKILGGKKYIWVGIEKTETGWMEFSEYQRAIKRY